MTVPDPWRRLRDGSCAGERCWVLEAGVFDLRTGRYDPDAIYVIVGL